MRFKHLLNGEGNTTGCVQMQCLFLILVDCYNVITTDYS